VKKWPLIFIYLIKRKRIKGKKKKRPMKGRTKHRREPKEGNIKLNMTFMDPCIIIKIS